MLGKQNRLRHLDKFGRRFSSNKPKEVKKLVAVSVKKGVVENFSDISSSQDSPQPTSRRLIAREGVALSGKSGVSPSNENDSTLSPSEPKEQLALINLVERDTTRSEMGSSIKPPNIYSAFEGSKGAKRIGLPGMNSGYTSVNVWKHSGPELDEMSAPLQVGSTMIQSPMNSHTNNRQEVGNFPGSSPYARSPSNKGAGTLGTLAELSKESQANSGSVPRLSVSSKSPRNRSLNALMRNSWRMLDDQEEVHRAVPGRISFPKGAGSAFGSPTRSGNKTNLGGSSSANVVITSSPRDKNNLVCVPPVTVITAPLMHNQVPVSLDVSLGEVEDNDSKQGVDQNLVEPKTKSPSKDGDMLRSSLILKSQKPSSKLLPKNPSGGGVSSALKLIQNQYRHKVHTAARLPHQKTLSGTQPEAAQGTSSQTESKMLLCLAHEQNLKEQKHSQQFVSSSAISMAKPQNKKGPQKLKPSSSPSKNDTERTPKRPFFTKKQLNTEPSTAPADSKDASVAKPQTLQTATGRYNPGNSDAKSKSAKTNVPMTALTLIDAANIMQAKATAARITELHKSSSVKNVGESREASEATARNSNHHGLNRSGAVKSFVGIKATAMMLPQQGIAAMAAAKTGDKRGSKEQAIPSMGGRDKSKDSTDSRFAQQFASRSLAKFAENLCAGLPAKKMPATVKSKQNSLLFVSTLSSTPGTTSREGATLSSRADKQSLLASERAHLEFEKKKQSYLHRLGVVGNQHSEQTDRDNNDKLSTTRSTVRDKILAFLNESGKTSEREKLIKDCYYFSDVFSDYIKQSQDEICSNSAVLPSLNHLSSNITGYYAVTRMEKLQSCKKQRASWSNLIISTPKKLNSTQKDRSKQFSQSKLAQGAISKSSKKIAIIFDMDETLMHCPLQRDGAGTADKITASELSQANFIIRPGVLEGLQLLKKDFVLGLFTSSDQFYADTALKRLNLDVFDFKLYRQHCREVSKGLYVKDLKAAKSFCDSERCFLVDNNMYCYSPQLHQGIPILPFYGSPNDSEFLKLTTYLQQTLLADDPFKFNSDYFGYDIFGVGGEAAAPRLIPLLLERVLQRLQSRIAIKEGLS